MIVESKNCSLHLFFKQVGGKFPFCYQLDPYRFSYFVVVVRSSLQGERNANQGYLGKLRQYVTEIGFLEETRFLNAHPLFKHLRLPQGKLIGYTPSQ